MMRHEQFMKAKAAELNPKWIDNAEQAGKEVYGNVDMVNSPPHYNQTGIECIDAISAATGDGYKYYLQGNIMKYLWRFDYKNKPVEDLEKARWYLDRLIEEVMADES